MSQTLRLTKLQALTNLLKKDKVYVGYGY